MPGKEIIIDNPFHLRDQRYDFYPQLSLVPAQFELDNTEIELAATSIGGPTVSEWEKRTLLASWIDSVEANSNFDLHHHRLSTSNQISQPKCVGFKRLLLNPCYS